MRWDPVIPRGDE
jgi:N-acetylneuraminic acid mutarotase